MPQEDPVVEFKEFTGLRNTVPAESMSPKDLVVAENVDIGDAGEIRRRSGHTPPLIAGVAHSLWAHGDLCLSVVGTSLVRIHPDLQTQTLRTGLPAGARLSYALVGDRVYYTGPGVAGSYDPLYGSRETWGTFVPGLPQVEIRGGRLPAGTYQYLLTYIREDGQESGAGRAGAIEVPADGAILFSGLPSPADQGVEFVAIYLTEANGAAFYLAAKTPHGITSALVVAPPMGWELRTQHLGPAPAGEIAAVFNGHAMIATGNLLYPSEAFSPELFDLRKAIPFTSRITLVAPVRDGVFVGTEREHVFLAGTTPDAFAYVPKLPYGAVPGTLAYASAKWIAEAAGDGLAPVWVTTGGVVAGFDGGVIRNLTEDKFEFPAQDRGAGVVRTHRGVVQYLTILEGAEGPTTEYQ